MADSYLNTKPYQFDLRRSVKIGAVKLSRTETHTALGTLLNAIVEQEGSDAITRAERQ